MEKLSSGKPNGQQWCAVCATRLCARSTSLPVCYIHLKVFEKPNIHFFMDGRLYRKLTSSAGWFVYVHSTRDDSACPYHLFYHGCQVTKVNFKFNLLDSGQTIWKERVTLKLGNDHSFPFDVFPYCFHSRYIQLESQFLFRKKKQ